jgi:polar amino acid transport system permease protein
VEAGRCLGLSGVQVFRHVVLFPAIKVIYPALSSQFVLLMLATSVVSQISAPDLFHVASIIQSRTFRDFEIYAVVSAIYLALALAMKLGFAAIHHFAFGRR